MIALVNKYVRSFVSWMLVSSNEDDPTEQDISSVC